MISIERKAKFFLRLNAELQYVEAIMTTDVTFEITENLMTLQNTSTSDLMQMADLTLSTQS